MATSSPVTNKSSTEAGVGAGAVPGPAIVNGGVVTPQRSVSFDPPKQNLRGLNKPKCIKCGNVARSRCPFQSCKSCCAKAQNPCYIHVLKQNGILPEKPPPSSSPMPEQQSSDTSSTGAALRLTSLRQLSSTYVNSLRSKRPLSRKDAVNINKWRFAKLKEYTEGNIEAENEAFDRYMQNMRLLEETFLMNSSLDGLSPDGLPMLEGSSSEDDHNILVSGIKVKLKANPQRVNDLRSRLQAIVDQGLKKLQKWEFDDDDVLSGNDDLDKRKKPKSEEKLRAERNLAVNDLLDKLKKARNEDDLNSCLETKLQLFKKDDKLNIHISRDQSAGDVIESTQASQTSSSLFSYAPPKVYTTVEINEDHISNVEAQLSFLDQIAEL